MVKRKRPSAHLRKVSTIHGTEYVIINKHIKKKQPLIKKKLVRKRVVVGSRERAASIIQNLMKENMALNSRQERISNRMSKLYPLGLAERDKLDREKDALQRDARNNRDRIRFLEQQYNLDMVSKKRK